VMFPGYGLTLVMTLSWQRAHCDAAVQFDTARISVHKEWCSPVVQRGNKPLVRAM
jgi:hypothetical protein